MPQTTNDDDQDLIKAKELQNKLSTADPTERQNLLTETIREQASAVLDQPTFTLDTNFIENGLTSLRALELTHKLTTLTGIEIPLVAVIEHPTPQDLGHYMATTPTD
jgi:aryl carrier-like protein